MQKKNDLKSVSFDCVCALQQVDFDPNGLTKLRTWHLANAPYIAIALCVRFTPSKRVAILAATEDEWTPTKKWSDF